MEAWAEQQQRSREGTTTGSMVLIFLVFLLIIAIVAFGRGQQQRGVPVEAAIVTGETTG